MMLLLDYLPEGFLVLGLSLVGWYFIQFLDSFLLNIPARIRFAESYGIGRPVEIAFEPRLPACPKDLRKDTADDIGVFRWEDDMLLFRGDHVEFDVHLCDIREVHYRRHWRQPPMIVFDLAEAFTHRRFSLYLLISGSNSLHRSRRPSMELVNEIRSRLDEMD